MLFSESSTVTDAVTLVADWIATNWVSTVNEVVTLASWRYSDGNFSFSQIEDAFLVNEGDVESTLAFLDSKQVVKAFLTN